MITGLNALILTRPCVLVSKMKFYSIDFLISPSNFFIKKKYFTEMMYNHVNTFDGTLTQETF